MSQPIIDHLFRHQYGKMVAILTKVFGFEHLDLIEDAVQDTFAKAIQSWRVKMPNNPEAWLTQAAKNRVIDLFRKINTADKHTQLLNNGTETIAIQQLFLDTEIADSQLSMIFTACHPALAATEQIAFALKTISGFSQKEIAAALLLKPETVKKRLQRARKTIVTEQIAFKIPQGNALKTRLARVHEVIYLIFNEGFHSTHKTQLVREELCTEAMRLDKLLIEHPQTALPNSYALAALLSFHAARIDSKMDEHNAVVNFRNQDRSLWHQPLINYGNKLMFDAVMTDAYSVYHYEAAIASEHLCAKTFEETNWSKIDMWYNQLYAIAPSEMILLNMAVIQLELKNLPKAQQLLQQIDAAQLGQRAYLYYATWSDYYLLIGNQNKALEHIVEAIQASTNTIETAYLKMKKALCQV